jgi:hypothetical protein
VVNRVLDIVFRRERIEPAIPVCPDHKVEMQMRGKMGRPARFSDTTEESYAIIYYCPVPGCDHSKEVNRRRSQIAVPGEAPARPDFSRRGD